MDKILIMGLVSALGFGSTELINEHLLRTEGTATFIEFCEHENIENVYDDAINVALNENVVLPDFKDFESTRNVACETGFDEVEELYVDNVSSFETVFLALNRNNIIQDEGVGNVWMD